MLPADDPTASLDHHHGALLAESLEDLLDVVGVVVGHRVAVRLLVAAGHDRGDPQGVIPGGGLGLLDQEPKDSPLSVVERNPALLDRRIHSTSRLSDPEFNRRAGAIGAASGSAWNQPR